MEMFEAFGFSERVLKEAYWVNETTFWKPDDDAARDTSSAAAGSRMSRTGSPSSRMSSSTRRACTISTWTSCATRRRRLEPDYARRLLDLEIDPAASSGDSAHHYPVTVRLERIDPAHEGQIETVKARYVVGCDGARSTVRKSLGRALHGDSANQAWGVMDVLAVTDFPDIRLKALIQSADEGNIAAHPAGGRLSGPPLCRARQARARTSGSSSRNITVDQLIAAAQRILHPYTLDVKEVAWWSVYEIGQRLCDKFDDVPEERGRRRACRACSSPATPATPTARRPGRA